MKNEDFAIFVSYAHEDKKLVESVCQKLSSAGLSIWIDKEIHHGESISSRIVKAIERARFVLFFSSKYSNKSDYCIGEVLVAVQKKKCIIPIKIDPTDYCDDLLVHLIRLHYVNFINGFSQDEYNELFSVLSGCFRSAVTEIRIEDTKNNMMIKNRFQWIVILMFAIILTLALVLILRNFPEVVSDQINSEIPKGNSEEIKSYSRKEHNVAFSTPSYELSINNKLSVKKIIIVVESAFADDFKNDICKYKDKVLIEPNYEHETPIVTFYCEGDSFVIDKIRYLANKWHVKVGNMQ